MRFLGLASVAAILAVAGVGTASTLRSGRTSETTSEGNVVVPDTKKGATQRQAPAAAPVVQQSISATPAPETAAPVAAPEPKRPLAHGGFVVVEGRTRLTDSIYAMRSGDSVVVNFDAYGYRTRRSAKFEQSLRLTLPMVLGRTATASLDTVAAGGVVTSKDVTGVLANDGMWLRLDNGATAHIRVLTRVVSDGPIAIGYLATIER
jgi:hypothetical protein